MKRSRFLRRSETQVALPTVGGEGMPLGCLWDTPWIEDAGNKYFVRISDGR